MYSVGLEKDFIFVHIPKTGGGAIKNHILKHVPRENLRYPKDIYHASIADYKEAIDNDPDCRPFKDYYAFTVVRNPWDKMVSLFEWKKNGTPDSVYKSVNQKIQPSLIKGRKHVQKPSIENSIPQDLTFLDFCLNLDKFTDHRDIADFFYWQFLGPNEEQDKLHILEFNQISDDAGMVSFWNERIGIPAEPLMKIHKTEHSHYLDYYSNTEAEGIFLQGFVYGLFVHEINYLGWSLDGIRRTQ